MIGFLTFFVGLIFGVQNIELTVSGPVARVDLLLDGSLVASASHPPWRFEVDFGPELHPTKIEAVAFSSEGSRISGDVRWVNLPEAKVDAAIVPEVDSAGRIIAATLTWRSPEFDRPRELRVRLDGVPIPVRPPHRIDLSHVAQGELHMLDAEFEFSPDLCLKRQLPFGKGFVGDASSGLTATPISLDGIDELPHLDGVTGWFEASGESLRVAGTEREEARLVIVRDPGAEQKLLELSAERKSLVKRDRRRGAAKDLDLLGDDTQIHVLVPEPVVAEGRSSPTLLFPYSKRGFPGGEGVLRAALAPRNDRMLGVGLMLPDAVAQAGLHAAEGNRRRAVLLLLGGEREDMQRFDPEIVRGFLKDLRVPLVVWDLSGEGSVAPAQWRPDRSIGDFDDFARGLRRVRHMLEEQRIVWLGGRHLPQTIVLGPAARGITLVE